MDNGTEHSVFTIQFPRFRPSQQFPLPPLLPPLPQQIRTPPWAFERGVVSLRNTYEPGIIWKVGRNDFEPCVDQVTSIGGVETVCSYTWKKSPLGQPGTIFVPGAPPKWAPPALPKFVPADDGPYYVDENRTRSPKYMFEPIFQAISVMNAELSFEDIDVICDRGSLARLIAFASPHHQQNPFEIAARMYGNTLFLCRNEGREWSDTVQGNRSGGHNFEDMFTEDACGIGPLRSGYYRVHEYKFGNMTVMVRHEVDAYYEVTDTAAPSIAELLSETVRPQDTSNVGITSHHPATAVEIKGYNIPAGKMAEIKSHSNHNPFFQMWLGRTKWLLRGDLGNGWVQDFKVRNKEKKFAKYERNEQLGLRKSSNLFRMLKEIVGRAENQKAVVTLPDVHLELEMRKMNAEFELIPADFVEKYFGGGDSGMEASDPMDLS